MSAQIPATPPLPWLQPGWRAAVEAWIHEQLAEHGIAPTGPVEEVKIRVWSAVLRVPAVTGACYFKAPAPVMAHEVALTEALARWQPGRVASVICADSKRGWLLLRDGGPHLRSVIAATGDYTLWYRALAEYAELQIALTHHIDEMLAMGVPDRRLSHLPALYDDMLDDESLLLVGMPGGLSPDELARLRSLSPRVRERCAELDSFDLPASLDHNDIHDGNMLLTGADKSVAFDWGDASVAHPFSSLTVALRMVAFSLRLPVARPLDIPQAVRARDAYLEPWTRFALRERLHQAGALAFDLGMISRALLWRQVLASVDETQRGTEKDALASWLQTWLSTNMEAG